MTMYLNRMVPNDYRVTETKFSDPVHCRHNFTGREMAELTWLVSHENILAFLKEVPRQRQRRIRFEHLLKQPRETLQGLCASIGIDFDTAMLRPYETGRMTDGVHRESIQVGDYKFAEHKAVRPEVAESWRREYRQDSLGERTRALAEELGFSVRRSASTGRGAIMALPRVAKRVKG